MIGIFLLGGIIGTLYFTSSTKAGIRKRLK